MSEFHITTNFPSTLKNVEAAFAVNDEFLSWIMAQAGKSDAYLLAHADDGVIWGRIGNNASGGKQLFLSRDAVADRKDADHFPSLSIATLQTMRLFSESFEVLLWKATEGWKARRIEHANSESEATWAESFDEDQMLWGDKFETVSNGFTLLEHGQEGLRHIVPVRCSPETEHPLKLRVRHYLNNKGMARIVASRLVGFITEN